MISSRFSIRKFRLRRSRRAVVFRQSKCWWKMDTTVILAVLGTTNLCVSENGCTLGDMSTRAGQLKKSGQDLRVNSSFKGEHFL